MDRVLREDLERIILDNRINVERFRNRTFLITGATGLIAYNLINLLLLLNDKEKLQARIIASVRNKGKALKIYGERSDIRYIQGDIISPFSIDEHIDYIVHTASQTDSRAFVDDPIGVIETTIQGTRNVLDFACRDEILGIAYLSTMEVYGAHNTGTKMTEIHNTNIDTMMVRSSYPESKRLAECMCAAYTFQKHIPVKVLRLTQTFGPGVKYQDRRVFAEFARCAIEGRDIILHTNGDTTRNYLYTADAVTAILAVLEKGINGMAYNVANENIFCSIREMAEMFCKESESSINVLFKLEDESLHGYAPIQKTNLDTARLRSLGWSAHYDMPEMIHRLCETMKESGRQD